MTITYRYVFHSLTCLVFLMSPSLNLKAGTYTESAHGSNGYGVLRTSSNSNSNAPGNLGYARGNCAHCHEQHASIEGSEPDPTGGPSNFALFADNFSGGQDTDYIEADNFCFYCHNGGGSAQQVDNNDYSQTFGCAQGTQSSILATINQQPGSGHNLNDILVNFAGDFTGFTSQSNPCNACHNPHLAKRNWTKPLDLANSAISRPTDLFNLWGITSDPSLIETMETAYQTQYEPPYCDNTSNREPAASPDADTGRARTPNYVAFCVDCHDSNSISSYTLTNNYGLGRNVYKIDWTITGDKHGESGNGAGNTIKQPYNSGQEYVLSCSDCHEPHGAPNIMLVRRKVNGSDLGGNITDFESNQWGFLCKSCHKDDLDVADEGMDPPPREGTGNEYAWKYIHHNSQGPYSIPLPAGIQCQDCHPGSPTSNPVNCGTTGLNVGSFGALQCHVHGEEF